jgi:peptidoglycan-associated lipoprotein
MRIIRQVSYIMATILRNLFFLSLVALIFPACTRPQSPSPSDTISNRTGSSDTDLSNDFIPDGLASEYGFEDSGLQVRDHNEGITNGKYGDRTMLTGILPSVYFGFNSSSISAAERSKLQQAADYLNDHASAGLLIEGYCDWYGTAEYNLALGDRRANSAREYISTLGIDANRIESLSKGSLQAIPGLAKNQSFQDRRADLIILE